MAKLKVADKVYLYSKDILLKKFRYRIIRGSYYPPDEQEHNLIYFMKPELKSLGKIGVINKIYKQTGLIYVRIGNYEIITVDKLLIKVNKNFNTKNLEILYG